MMLFSPTTSERSKTTAKESIKSTVVKFSVILKEGNKEIASFPQSPASKPQFPTKQDLSQFLSPIQESGQAKAQKPFLPKV